MYFTSITGFNYLGMIVKNLRDNWVIPMPKNALGHVGFFILPVRPLPQKFI
jgi:hypothetical protein